jgi:hypothetical protein
MDLTGFRLRAGGTVRVNHQEPPAGLGGRILVAGWVSVGRGDRSARLPQRPSDTVPDAAPDRAGLRGTSRPRAVMKSFEGADELRGTPKHDRVMPCVLFEHPAHLGVTIATSIDGEIRRPLRRLPRVSTLLVHCLLALPPHPPSRCDALPRVEVNDGAGSTPSGNSPPSGGLHA